MSSNCSVSRLRDYGSKIAKILEDRVKRDEGRGMGDDGCETQSVNETRVRERVKSMQDERGGE